MAHVCLGFCILLFCIAVIYKTGGDMWRAVFDDADTVFVHLLDQLACQYANVNRISIHGGQFCTERRQQQKTPLQKRNEVGLASMDIAHAIAREPQQACAYTHLDRKAVGA
ncbi:hypothetical protein PR202_gb08803 [Eleusine coracana subsp. coracana]|uniref:Secreted protein n=1 Tax=Eleusine coracana subsp. coracana TaxID=191504 RepID=A0AAV5EFB6_ELECO|nr:hypothetical protein PR202_gb08803 [Eleusine coracana subsp. coracana]